jgi:predicted RecB family nuclease
MPTPVTASMLYNLVMCPHRVTMDLNGDPARRDEPNPFVKMLWERGSLYERDVISGLDLPFVDLSGYSGDEKERLTLEAMQRGEPLIYSGRIQEPGLLGDPDLLRKETGGYVAGDIKSGAGEEGPDDDPSPKLHYAVQLALYTDILERKGLSPGRRAFVWDIHGDEVPYDFMALYGKRNPRTLWQDYEDCIAEARAIITDPNLTRAAYSSACKFCHWYSACIERLVATEDLTLIPELGRPKRDAMLTHLDCVSDLAACNPDGFITGKKTVFHGIGPDTLKKFHTRAKLLTAEDAKPILHRPIALPGHDLELFFDIEVDPMRDMCYLHGFVERRARDNATERFVAFFTPECTPAAERAAFADALAYMRQSRPCAI